MSKKTKHILIIEDEVFVALQLQSILKELGYEKTSVASSYEQALSVLGKERIDAVISDINLQQAKSGIDVAKHLDRLETRKIPYLFISAHGDSDTIREVSELRAKHFIRKPFDKDDIRIAIELHLFPSANQKNKSLKFQVGRIEIETDIDDIIYLESNDNFVVIHTLKGHHRVYQTLKSFLDLLPSKFMQVHRSFIVNLKYINEVKPDSIIIGSKEVPISRKFKKPFRANYFQE